MSEFFLSVQLARQVLDELRIPSRVHWLRSVHQLLRTRLHKYMYYRDDNARNLHLDIEVGLLNN